VADSFNHTIRKVAPAGDVSTLAGCAPRQGGQDGNGGTARFRYPLGVAVHSGGNALVADSTNYTIRKISPMGQVTTLAGLAGNQGSQDGSGGAARFAQCEAIAVDTTGTVFLADTWNHTIRKVTSAGAVTTLAGLAGTSGSQDGTGSAARFFLPKGIAVDGAGNVLVADSNNHTIRKVTPAGVVTTLAGLAGNIGSRDGAGSMARFSQPEGVAVDANGVAYVADTWNHTIRKITPDGEVSTVAGVPEVEGSQDGTGSEARFYAPKGIAVDAAGNLFVADSNNYTIRMIAPGGAVGTIGGWIGRSGHRDGIGANALFALTGKRARVLPLGKTQWT